MVKLYVLGTKVVHIQPKPVIYIYISLWFWVKYEYEYFKRAISGGYVDITTHNNRNKIKVST